MGVLSLVQPPTVVHDGGIAGTAAAKERCQEGDKGEMPIRHRSVDAI
jgi:hypothetical protein